MTNQPWRPPRANSLGIKCGECGVKFAAGHVPPVEQYGRWAGQHRCRACKAREAAAADPQLFDMPPR